MSRTFVVILVSSFLSVVFIFLFFFIKESHTPDEYKTAVITDIQDCDLLKLSEGNISRLAGIEILKKDHVNYRRELCESFEKYLLNQKIRYKIIKKEGLYPDHDLILAYLSNGTFVNEYLLMNGLALYDYGYYPGNEKFHELQNKAQKNKAGTWGSSNPPEAIYAGPNNSIGYHYIECPNLDRRNKENWDYFYFLPEYTTGGRVLDRATCNYCSEKFWKYYNETGIQDIGYKMRVEKAEPPEKSQ